MLCTYLFFNYLFEFVKVSISFTEISPVNIIILLAIRVHWYTTNERDSHFHKISKFFGKSTTNL